MVELLPSSQPFDRLLSSLDVTARRPFVVCSAQVDQGGLTAAIEGLQNIDVASESSRYWIAAAKRAQGLIDVSATLTFQRAPVQEALRTTVDAFIAIGQGL